jgi:hypothetical protein
MSDGIGESQAVCVEDSPRLMVICRHRLSEFALANLRASCALFLAGKREFLVFDDGLDVFQLLDGEWKPLVSGPSVPSGFDS